MSIKIAICQFHIKWEDKKYNISRAIEFMKTAANAKVDLILFPEMSFTGFSMNVENTKEKNEETLCKMREYAQLYQIAIGFGWVKESGKKVENHYTVLNGEGKCLVDYIKIHSFHYGGEGERFQSGNEVDKFELNNMYIAPFICYDLRFPEIFRTSSEEVSIFIVPANWPEKRKEHWKTLLRARAIENQAFVIGINCVGEIGDIRYSGDSCVVDPNGNILQEVSENEELFFVEIQEEEMRIREDFPVQKDRKKELYKRL